MSKRPSNPSPETTAKRARLDEHGVSNERLPQSPSSASKAAQFLAKAVDTGVIRRSLTSLLGTKDYLALMGTSKAIRHPLYTDRFDVDRCLKRFVSDPHALRAALRDSGSLVTGSFVLQVLEGTRLLDSARWDDSSLDIISHGVYAGNNVVDLAFPIKLILGDGYRAVEKERCEERGGLVVRYEKTGDGREKRVIRVICTCLSPPAACLLQRSRMTATLNIMSWNKIFSLFPHTTFVERKSHMLQSHVDVGVAKHIRKYIERGWKVESMASPKEGYRGCGLTIHTRLTSRDISTLPPSLLSIRRVGDRRCCTVKLSTDGLQSAATACRPDSVLELSEFCLELMHNGLVGNSLRVRTCRVNHPLLGYTYLCSGKSESPWMKLVAWLSHNLRVQAMAKMGYRAHSQAALGLRVDWGAVLFLIARRRQLMSGLRRGVVDDRKLYDEGMLERYAKLERDCHGRVSKDMVKSVTGGLV